MKFADHTDFQAWWHIWLDGCLIILAVICLMLARNAKTLTVWNVLTCRFIFFLKQEVRSGRENVFTFIFFQQQYIFMWNDFC